MPAVLDLGSTPGTWRIIPFSKWFIIPTYNWAVLSDEQMSNGYPFSLVNDEQMSNKVGVKHQPDKP